MNLLEHARHLAIWGFGREGQAAFRFIVKNYPHIRITILNDAALPEATSLAAQVNLIHGHSVPEAVRSGAFDLIIKSPGISLYREEVLEAKRAGVRFTSVTNLWFEQARSSQTIAVTGTKGKSTTSRLLHHMLLTAGTDVELIGNIGVPALGHPKASDYSVLELSSYQIADLEYAPDIAVVTSLYPEHAPWHGGAEQYFRDKLRILALSDRTRVVCNYADERLRTRLSRRRDIYWFNGQSGYRVHEGRLHHNETPVDCSNFPLKGEHNLSNLAAACTVADLIGLHMYRRAVDMRSFEQLPHRLEEFQIEPGLLCVNDSISTVPEATIAALKTYPDQDIVLLLGGSDRGQDYAQLYDLLPRTRVISLILLPPNGDRILAELSRRPWPFSVTRAADLEDAVKEGIRRVSDGGLFLLSPAAPSFGAFRDFEERGGAFKALCHKYAKLFKSPPRSPER